MKDKYKIILITSGCSIIFISTLIIHALLFPFLYQEYWKPTGFVCPEDSFCIIDDFRTDFDFFFRFFGSLITILVILFSVFYYWLMWINIDEDEKK